MNLELKKTILPVRVIFFNVWLWPQNWQRFFYITFERHYGHFGPFFEAHLITLKFKQKAGQKFQKLLVKHHFWPSNVSPVTWISYTLIRMCGMQSTYRTYIEKNNIGENSCTTSCKLLLCDRCYVSQIQVDTTGVWKWYFKYFNPLVLKCVKFSRFQKCPFLTFYVLLNDEYW